mgnify:CR=1 FL=1
MPELTNTQLIQRAQHLIDNKLPINYNRDIRPLVERLNLSLLPEGGPMAAPETPPFEEDLGLEEVPPELPPGAEAAGEAPEGGTVEMQPLMDVLGVDEMQAQSLYDAAQEMDQTRGKTPDELATMLEEDFDLRMRLESLAAGSSDQMAADAEMAGMMPPGPPPGPPPGAGPPGAMPPGLPGLPPELPPGGGY